MKLPNVLDLAACAGLHESILRELKSAGRVRIDASDVEVLTLPCMQVILAAARGGAAVENPSTAFIEAFETLGLDWAASGGMPEAVPQPVDAIPVTETHSAGNSVENSLESSEAVTSLRVLTIDDSKTMRDMLMLTLADAGFDVIQAVDGQDGIEMLDRENVDVVICDINMPRMDGYEVVRRMRARPEHKLTPILMLTTESETEKKNLAREIGATGWMVKPFDPDRLIATVRKVAC